MRVYYNENDEFMSEWLLKLMDAEAIPRGDIDTRSIEDVEPDDLRGYDQCHFFAGLGAWAYALHQARWPDEVKVWTGSCPCQPFSASGKKKGFNDKRHLWPAWGRLIGECGPAVVLGEQVSGKDGYAWLDGVSTDLEDCGYAFGALDLTAAVVGSPQKRQRLYFVAEGLADAPMFHESRDIEIGLARQIGIGADRGAGSHDIADPLGPWEAHDIVACRDGWGRAVESGTHPLAPRFAAHMDVMSGLGNAIVAPLAVEFIRSYMEAGMIFDVSYNDDVDDTSAGRLMHPRPLLSA